MSGSKWTPAYVGLGSNLDDPLRQIEAGFAALKSLPETLLVACSRRYRSQPMGPRDQPDFVNAVAGLLTRLAPEALLRALKQLETTLGRAQPVTRWGPRRIDFDLLVFGRETSSDAALTVPHPGIAQRNWVLYPLSDIAPDLHIPGLGRAAVLAARLGTDGIEVLPVAPARSCVP